jgi:hypothetical protein
MQPEARENLDWRAIPSVVSGVGVALSFFSPRFQSRSVKELNVPSEVLFYSVSQIS